MTVDNRQGIDPLSPRLFALLLESMVVKSRIEKTVE